MNFPGSCPGMLILHAPIAITKVVGKTVFTAEHNPFSTAFSSVFPKGKNKQVKLNNRFSCCRGRGKMSSRHFLSTDRECDLSFCEAKGERCIMQRLSYPTETVLSHKMTRNRIDLSFKDSPRKPKDGDGDIRSKFVFHLDVQTSECDGRPSRNIEIYELFHKLEVSRFPKSWNWDPQLHKNNQWNQPMIPRKSE